MGAAKISIFFFFFLQCRFWAQKLTQKDCKSANSFLLHRGGKEDEEEGGGVPLKSTTDVNTMALK